MLHLSGGKIILYLFNQKAWDYIADKVQSDIHCTCNQHLRVASRKPTQHHFAALESQVFLEAQLPTEHF